MKVAFVHKLIYDYRLSFYDMLGDEPDIDLTVLHSGQPMASQSSSFTEVILAERKVGGFLWQSDLESRLKDQDVVVYLFDIRYLSTIWHLGRCRVRRKDQARVLFWGIGFGTSFIGRLAGNRLRVPLTHLCEGVAVYMPKNKVALVRAGVAAEKVFVAPNTVQIKKPFLPKLSNRCRFVFLGSLKSRKRLEDLLIAFAEIVTKLPANSGVDIIGGGDIHHYQKIASSLGIADKVKFHGHVTDEAIISEVFSNALACISPGQIGLTVLHSFAFGTPFVTSYDAISGGEIENLTHGHTGMFYDGSVGQLSDVMLAFSLTPEMSHQMGEAAYLYYSEKMTLDKLTGSFLNQFRRVNFD